MTDNQTTDPGSSGNIKHREHYMYTQVYVRTHTRTHTHSRLGDGFILGDHVLWRDLSLVSPGGRCFLREVCLWNMKVTINLKLTAAAFRGAERSPGQGKREVSQRSKVPGPLSPRMQAWEHVGILCPPRGEIKACLRQSAPSSGFRFTVGGTNPTTSLKRRPHQSVQGFVLLASTKTPPSWGDDRRYCIAPQRRNQSLLRCRGRTCRSQDPGLHRHPLRGPWQEGGSFFFTRVPY